MPSRVRPDDFVKPGFARRSRYADNARTLVMKNLVAFLISCTRSYVQLGRPFLSKSGALRLGPNIRPIRDLQPEPVLFLFPAPAMAYLANDGSRSCARERLTTILAAEESSGRA